MNSGSYTERLRNRTLFFASQLNTAQPKQFESPQTLLETMSGGFPSYLNYKAMDVDFLPTQTLSTERPYTLDTAILVAFHGILQYAANANLGPTRCSRFFYLWFFTVTAGYNWISSTSTLSGTKDTWNWDTKYVQTTELGQFIWMNHLLIDLMPTFVPGYNTNDLVQNEARAFNLTSEQINDLVTSVRSVSNWSLWKSNWDTWWAYRQSDGNVAASIPPEAALPNGTQTIEVTTTTDDPSTFPNPAKWTPLRINGAKKNYLTYGWNDVLSSTLTADQETTIKNTGQVYFPGTASSWNDGSTKANELYDLVQLTNSLTEEQKAIAEFWAGGPFTVSPPGMMLWIWANYMDALNIAQTKGFNVFLYSGFDLAIHLFETGRLVWGLKKYNMEARPIQYIRHLYRTDTLTKYDGTSYLGASWVPFQAPNFVTPPFADFPSGHSAFSQSFANVMTTWFSESIETIQFTMKTLPLLSPTFKTWETLPFGTFLIGQGTSEIQPNEVPTSTITLSWTSWQAMADSSGVSRQYGGIHCKSAHQGSQALANALTPIVHSYWQFI